MTGFSIRFEKYATLGILFFIFGVFLYKFIFKCRMAKGEKYGKIWVNK